MERARCIVEGGSMAKIGIIVAIMVATVALLRVPALAGAEDWNDANIRWLKYDEGLATAKKEQKPVCLVFFTSWCPHCANFAKVFQSPDVVAKSKAFVMVRINGDDDRALSDQYKPDGSYIPRTFFLSPQGELIPELTAGRAQYKYFYDEFKPAGILAGMDAALQKFSKP